MLQAVLMAGDTKINPSGNCCAKGAHRLDGGTNIGQNLVVGSTVIDVRRVLWRFRRETFFLSH